MAQILIADDDPAQGNALVNLLTQTPGVSESDVALIKASTSAQMIAGFGDGAPRVVVVALTGQGTRALSLCQSIRQVAATTRIAVVGAKIPAPEVLRQIETSFSARFFAQPFELSQLAGYVLSALGRAAAAPVKRAETSFGASEGGELVTRRLPAVLMDLVEASESGTLRVSRGKVRKDITIAKGCPIAVTSNAREETLGQFLLAQHVIRPNMHLKAIRMAADSKRRLGGVLVELGAISQVQLANALSAQVRFKIARSLRWPDGSWQFAPRVDIGPNANEAVDIVALILRSLKGSLRLSPMPIHLVGIADTPLRLNSRGRRLQPAWEAVFGHQLSKPFQEAHNNPHEGSLKISDLLRRGFSRAGVYGLIDALWHSDALTLLEVTSAVDHHAPEGLSVAELSADSHRRKTENPAGEPLFDLLFADAVDEFRPAANMTGAQPLLPDDPASTPKPAGARVVATVAAAPVATPTSPAAAARMPRPASEFGDQPTVSAPKSATNALLEIYLRMKGNDHYKVVGAAEGTSREQVENAIARTEAEMTRAGIDGGGGGGNELPLARAIRDIFQHARGVLLDRAARAEYDRELTAKRSATEGDPMRGELAFGRAMDALEANRYADAIRELHTAVEAAPEEATYRAELGWCHYIKAGRSARAADQARPHLNQALAIDVDHAGAHEYKGLISAALGTDEVEAIFHLQRALDADPSREAALEALEALLQRRGELRPLERHYRRMIQNASGTLVEVQLWLRMGRLYQNQLDDPESAQIAFGAAAQLAPDDAEVAAEIANASRRPDLGGDGAPLVARWLKHLPDREPGRKLHALALQAGAHDAAFIAASALIALGTADDGAEKTYRSYRPRFVVRAQRRFDGAAWDIVAHESDDPAIAELLALLAPVIHQLAPLTLTDLDVGERELVADDKLPRSFVRIREYVGHVLGVGQPRVYVRADFEQQVHVGGLNPPVLLAGEEVLTTPERLELVFRLGRAMSYLLPGRSLGGSHSGGLLKRVVLAAFYVVHPDTAPPTCDAETQAAIMSIEGLGGPTRRRLGELVDATAARSQNLNLSAWKQSLARTANRIGLLLCGDVPSAVRFTSDTGGSEAADEVLRWVINGGYGRARSALGLTIDV